MKAGGSTYVCCACKAEKSVTDFPRNRAVQRGYSSECKKCANARNREHYRKNADRLRESYREYSQMRREIMKRSPDEWRRRAERPKRSPLYYEIGRKLANAKYRSKERGLPFDLDHEYLLGLYEKQEGRCALSGRELKLDAMSRAEPDSLSLDRVDNEGGYVRGNVRLVTWAVNLALQDWGTDRFVEMCRNVVEHLGSGQ